MKIYPAIDLKDGRCVRLLKGNFDDMTVYEADPVTVAFDIAKKGAVALHVVDLDGAKNGRLQQADLISAIVRGTTLEVQSGGGIRTEDQAMRLLGAGVDRVVVGSLAVQAPDEARNLMIEVGPDRITLAVDVRCRPDGEPEAAVSGWTKDSGIRLWEVIERYLDLGIGHLLCTDIDRDGTLEGPNVELYRRLQERYPALEVQASGGIGSLDDLRRLKAAGVRAAIVGKALWEGKFRLEEALSC